MFCCTNNQGKGLFAARDYAEGDIIFVERPLVSAQFAWNAAYKYLACNHCMRSLETAEQMVRRLTGNASLALPHADCCSVQPSEHVVCHYCSVSCNVYFSKVKLDFSSKYCLSSKSFNSRLRTFVDSAFCYLLIDLIAAVFTISLEIIIQIKCNLYKVI